MVSRYITKAGVERDRSVEDCCDLAPDCDISAMLTALATKVGPRGKVLGIEHGPQMATIARQRTIESGFRNIELVEHLRRKHRLVITSMHCCFAMPTTFCNPAPSWKTFFQ